MTIIYSCSIRSLWACLIKEGLALRNSIMLVMVHISAT